MIRPIDHPQTYTLLHSPSFPALNPIKPDSSGGPSTLSVNEGVADKGSVSEHLFEGKKTKECETCKNRKYVDVSNDPNVSFKTPTHLSPGAAVYAVASHEFEHVTHEQTNAQQNGRKVLYQSVQIHTAICPECGRVYVAGGKTTTVTVEKSSPPEALGKNLDLKI
jgi:hypothetical protein